MVIKRKNIRPGGLLEVEADPTDLVDLNGFSAIINTAGAAQTAQFSGGSTMKANPGLKIGLTQLKINTGNPNPGRTRDVILDTGWSTPINSIDGDLDSSASLADPGLPLIIDFTSIDTQILKIQMGSNGGGSQQCSVEISDDNMSYASLGNISTALLTQLFDFGTQTWRFVKVTRLTAAGNPVTIIYEIFEDLPNDTVTVRVRSSATQDTANGTVIIPDQVMNPNETLTFDSTLLLTGVGQFVTLEYVSFTEFAVDVNLSEITSITEV